MISKFTLLPVCDVTSSRQFCEIAHKQIKFSPFYFSFCQSLELQQILFLNCDSNRLKREQDNFCIRFHRLYYSTCISFRSPCHCMAPAVSPPGRRINPSENKNMCNQFKQTKNQISMAEEHVSQEIVDIFSLFGWLFGQFVVGGGGGVC